MSQLSLRYVSDYQKNNEVISKIGNQLPTDINFFRRFGIDNYYEVGDNNNGKHHTQREKSIFDNKVTYKVRLRKMISIRGAILSLGKIVKEYRSKGINPVIFDASLDNLLLAIKEKKSIDGICLYEKLCDDPAFRFLSRHDPVISKNVADTFAAFSQNMTKTLLQKGAKAQAKISTIKRIEKADDFVQNMHPIIENLKNEKGVSTYEDTVRMLNENKVATAKGGRWHLKTLHALYKRYEKLNSENQPR